MGAWGTGSFDNDVALDWVGELKEAEDTFLLDDTLAQVADVEDNVETSDCCCAVAAAEVVAALQGRPADNLPEDAATFVSQIGVAPPRPLIELALRALDRIKTRSELQELWADSDDEDAWVASIEDLEARVA